MKARLFILLFAAAVANPITASPDLHAEIFHAARMFETLGHGRAPDATLEFPDLPSSDLDRKRLWRDVPSTNVIYKNWVLHMKIIRATASRATAEARVKSRVFYPARGYNGESEYAGKTTLQDRIELRRTGSGWQISAVVRDIN